MPAIDWAGLAGPESVALAPVRELIWIAGSNREWV